MKYFLLSLFVLCFLPVASAQVYTITETQLQKLEENLTKLELSKQSLQEQAKESEQRAQKLKAESEKLVQQLRAQVNTTTQLEESLTKYEEADRLLLNELEFTKDQLFKERLKNKELLNIVVCLCSIIILFVVIFGIGIYFKSKNVLKLF